jgi:MATE family multidrug resistance protein
MLFIGRNVAISVRVSNELGAGHPRATKFSVKIMVATSVLIVTMLLNSVQRYASGFPERNGE